MIHYNTRAAVMHSMVPEYRFHCFMAMQVIMRHRAQLLVQHVVDCPACRDEDIKRLTTRNRAIWF